MARRRCDRSSSRFSSGRPQAKRVSLKSCGARARARAAPHSKSSPLLRHHLSARPCPPARRPRHRSHRHRPRSQSSRRRRSGRRRSRKSAPSAWPRRRPARRNSRACSRRSRKSRTSRAGSRCWTRCASATGYWRSRNSTNRFPSYRPRSCVIRCVLSAAPRNYELIRLVSETSASVVHRARES